jgi:acyl carrier protein
MLDSLALEALIAWSEDELGVPLEDEDLSAENFASITAFSAFLDRKRTERVVAGADA